MWIINLEFFFYPRVKEKGLKLADKERSAKNQYGLKKIFIKEKNRLLCCLGVLF